MELVGRTALKLLAVAVLILLAVTLWRVLPHEQRTGVHSVPGEEYKFSVEVLNGTRVDGLARTMTQRLRSQGIDVVYFGSAFDSTLDSTLVLIRQGDSTAALAVRKALGTGRIVNDPDPRRLVDVTVILRLDAAALIGQNP